MKDREDKTELLKKLNVPVLFIAGEKDNVNPYEKSVEQSRLNDRIKFLSLSTCGHMGFIESKEETIVAIKELAGRMING